MVIHFKGREIVTPAGFSPIMIADVKLSLSDPLLPGQTISISTGVGYTDNYYCYTMSPSFDFNVHYFAILGKKWRDCHPDIWEPWGILDRVSNDINLSLVGILNRRLKRT